MGWIHPDGLNSASATTDHQLGFSNHGSATKLPSRFSNYASATKTNSHVDASHATSYYLVRICLISHSAERFMPKPDFEHAPDRWARLIDWQCKCNIFFLSDHTFKIFQAYAEAKHESAMGYLSWLHNIHPAWCSTNPSCSSRHWRLWLWFLPPPAQFRISKPSQTEADLPHSKGFLCVKWPSNGNLTLVFLVKLRLSLCRDVTTRGSSQQLQTETYELKGSSKEAEHWRTTIFQSCFHSNQKTRTETETNN